MHSRAAALRYSTDVNRDIIVYCSCTFILGLVIGSLLIGPHLAKSQPAAPAVEGGAPRSSAAAEDGGPPQTMNAVREQIATLKDRIEKNPNDAEALAQLGDMYMDAAKFPEAIGYLGRALAIREDPNVRIDLGICYKQNGQMNESLTAFKRAADEAPGQWQPLYNEAIVLGEMKRFDEARSLAAKLKAMRPDDPEVQRLGQTLATAK